MQSAVYSGAGPPRVLPVLSIWGPIGVWWQRWQLSGLWIDVLPRQSTAEARHSPLYPLHPPPTPPPAKPLLYSPALHQLFLTSNLTSPPVLQSSLASLPLSLHHSLSLGKHCRVSLTCAQVWAPNPPVPVANGSEIQTSTAGTKWPFMYSLAPKNFQEPESSLRSVPYLF